MATNQPTTGGTPAARVVSALQGEAWSLWNESYHAPDANAYRALSMTLYQQDLHERIERLYARLDQQNSELERHLPPEAA